MKKFVLPMLLLMALSAAAQTNSELFKHYEAYYQEMRKQGDVNGVISAITHLNVLQPSEARRDTLAFIYSNNGEYVQALNTIGVERNVADSDLRVQVKAISLKALNQPKRALGQFTILYKRNQTPYLAYEMADLKIMTGDNSGAMELVTYGIANAKDDMKYAFYERQEPYEVPLKAAFMHLKGLVEYNMDKTKVDQAIADMDEALKIAPNFNLASLSKQALQNRKDHPEGQEPAPATQN